MHLESHIIQLYESMMESNFLEVGDGSLCSTHLLVLAHLAIIDS